MEGVPDMGVCSQQPDNLGGAMRRLLRLTTRTGDDEAVTSRPLAHRVGSMLGRYRRPAVDFQHIDAHRGGEWPAEISGTRAADVVIVAALEEEYAALVTALGCTPSRDNLGRPIVTTEIEGLRIAIESLHGMGNANAASAASTLMVSWRAHYLILVGVTGGFESADVRPGDVVIPDQVVGYEAGKLTAEGAHRRPEVYRPDFDLLTAARAVEHGEWATAIRTAPPEPTHPPRIRFGTVLSGEKVMADADTAADLRQNWPKAVAIEMESYGSAL